MLYLIYGYLALFIMRPFENWTFLGAMHIERTYGILMLATLLLSRHKRSIRCPQTTAVLVFLGSLGISSVFSYRFALAAPAFYNYCTLVAFYVVILATIKNETQLRSFAIAYLCVMAAYQLLSLREYLLFGRGSWSAGMWRMRGLDDTFGHPNSVAASIVYSMPFAFGLLRSGVRKPMAPAIAAYSILSLTCILLTGSRSGFIGFLVLCLMQVLSLRGKRRLFVATAIFAVFLLGWYLVPSEKHARMRTLLGEHMNSGEQESASDRVRGAGFFTGVRMFRQRPLLGVGYGCFAAYAQEQLGERALDSHNLYGEVLGATGTLGLLSFTFLIVVAFKNALFVRKQVRTGIIRQDSPAAWVSGAALFMLLLLLVEGWASHNLGRYNWLWAGAIGALASNFVLHKESSKEREPHGTPAECPRHFT